MEKRCSKCGLRKPDTNEYFSKHSEGARLRSYCKVCATKHQNSYYEVNREAIRERSKISRETRKETAAEYGKMYREANRESLAEKKKLYQTVNKESLKEHRELTKEAIAKQRKLYLEENKEAIAERYKQWTRANLDKIRIKHEIRRSRKKQLPSTLTLEQWEEIKVSFKDKCCYCGRKSLLAQDHFVPLIKDGEYTHNNIVPACKSCNSSKGTKVFTEWYPTFNLYSKEREQKILKYLNYKNGIQQLALL